MSFIVSRPVTASLRAGGTPDQFRAAIDRAIEKRMVRTGTYVKFTQAGAALFA
jgi:hypothetical protein